MKDLFKALTSTTDPDKVGIICATAIMGLSVFSGRYIDGFAVFLFGASLFVFIFSMSLNAERKIEKSADGNTFKSFELRFTNYAAISWWLFIVAALLFVIFLLRIASDFKWLLAY